MTLTKQLPKTRFRGVDAHFESLSRSGGTRLDVHQFPGRDAPVIEDLGHDAKSISANLYVVGEDWQGQAARMASALDRHGPAGFFHPGKNRTFQVVVQTWSEEHSPDRIGEVKFSVKFLIDGGIAAILPSALSRFLAVVERLESVAGGLLTASFRISGFDDQVAGDAAERALDFLAEIDVSVETVPMQADIASRLVSTLSRWTAGLDHKLVAAPAGLMELPALLSLGVQQNSAIETRVLNSALVEAGNLSRGLTNGPINAIELFEGLSGWGETEDEHQRAETRPGGPQPTVWPGIPIMPGRNPTPAHRQRWQNRDALTIAARAVFTVAFADAILAQTHTSKRIAEDDLRRGLRRFETVISDLGRRKTYSDEWYALWREMVDAKTFFTRELSGRMDTLANVLIWDYGRNLPSVVMARELYNDYQRADELAAFNRVSHPGLMPRRGEYISPGKNG